MLQVKGDHADMLQVKGDHADMLPVKGDHADMLPVKDSLLVESNANIDFIANLTVYLGDATNVLPAQQDDG